MIGICKLKLTGFIVAFRKSRLVSNVLSQNIPRWLFLNANNVTVYTPWGIVLWFKSRFLSLYPDCNEAKINV